MSSLNNSMPDDPDLLRTDGESAAGGDVSQDKLSLTARQSEVLGLLCEGLPDKLIARRLDLSPHTIRGHIQVLYARLEVSTRMEALFAARRRGLIN